MNPTFFRELPASCSTPRARRRRAGVVLTGAGDAFSAGGDIASFQRAARHRRRSRRHLRLVFDAFHSIERAELPGDRRRQRGRLRRRHRDHPRLRHRDRLGAGHVRLPRGEGRAPARLRARARARRDRPPLDALARAHGRHHRRREGAPDRPRPGRRRRTSSCSTRRSRSPGGSPRTRALAVQVGKQFVNRDTGGTASPRRSRRRRCSSRRTTTRKGSQPSWNGGRRRSRAGEPVRVGVSIPVEEGLPIERSSASRARPSAAATTPSSPGRSPGRTSSPCSPPSPCATERVSIGTGVVPMSTRPVGLLAMGFQTLASLAPGRVIAGVGVSSPTVIERWHGREFAPPLALREGVPARVPPGPRRREARPRRRARPLEGVQDDAAAGHEDPRRRRRDAAAHGRPLRRARRRRLPHVVPARGGGRAGRARPRRAHAAPGAIPDELLIMASFFGYAGPELEAARERMRRYVMQYASVSTHRDSFARSIPNLPEVEAAWQAGDRKAGARADLRRVRRPAGAARRRRDRAARARPPRRRHRPADHGDDRRPPGRRRGPACDDRRGRRPARAHGPRDERGVTRCASA